MARFLLPESIEGPVRFQVIAVDDPSLIFRATQVAQRSAAYPSTDKFFFQSDTARPHRSYRLDSVPKRLISKFNFGSPVTTVFLLSLPAQPRYS
jgi:hypothetical protein